jgi:hypothetical protein
MAFLLCDCKNPFVCTQQMEEKKAASLTQSSPTRCAWQGPQSLSIFCNPSHPVFGRTSLRGHARSRAELMTSLPPHQLGPGLEDGHLESNRELDRSAPV